MIVISDTSPLNYLILIDCVDVLPELYGRVLIPQGVFEELQQKSTPQTIKDWIAARPDWLEIRQTRVQPDAALELLGVGERQAICLAQELKAAAIIIDEERGRKEARR
jgi:predicted nucleic acid-binding protein